MKRELFENIKVIPGGTGVVIDRTGFLSAVLGANVAAAGTLKIKLEHSDAEDGEFKELDDQYAGVTGSLKAVDVEAREVVNIDIDLLGCKNFIKITVEETAAQDTGEQGAADAETAKNTYAVVLGDPAFAPV